MSDLVGNPKTGFLALRLISLGLPGILQNADEKGVGLVNCP